MTFHNPMWECHDCDVKENSKAKDTKMAESFIWQSVSNVVTRVPYINHQEVHIPSPA